MDGASVPRRPCFAEEDDGLASLTDMEAGFSGSRSHHHHHPSFFSRPLYYTGLQRRGSLRSFSASSASSPRSGRLCDGMYEDHRQPHFLDACFLCKKPLGDDRDIFMYRGDTPFCSVECRQEQMERDEAEEKNRNISASIKAMRKDRSKSTSPSRNCDYPFRTGTLAAA